MGATKWVNRASTAEPKRDEEERLQMDREVEVLDEASAAIEEREDHGEDRQEREEELGRELGEVLLKAGGVAREAP